MTGAAEQTFFNERNVVVTNARFIASGRTFAMAQVSAVHAASDPWFRMSWFLPLVCGGLFGLFALMMIVMAVQQPAGSGGSSGLCAMVTGLPALASVILGAVVYFNREHYVVVATSGGNVNALASGDMEFIGRVANAVNSALVSRG